MFQSEIEMIGLKKKLPRIQLNDGGWYEGEWFINIKSVIVAVYLYNQIMNILNIKNWKNGNNNQGHLRLNKAEGKGKLRIHYKQIVYVDGDIQKGISPNAQFYKFGLQKQVDIIKIINFKQIISWRNIQKEFLNDLQYGKGIGISSDGKYKGFNKMEKNVFKESYFL
ncbi:hypothetical protein pb186bvf_020265 [Paramecium bursaria]